MLNKTTLDVQSATIRTRMFGGQSADDIVRDMPMLPVTAPFLSFTGWDVVRQAGQLGDEVEAPDPAVRTTKKVTVRPDGPYLTALVRQLLYYNGIYLSVYGMPTDQNPVQMTAGVHNCGTNIVFGPNPSRLMVIGKNLTPNELATGNPFSGKSSVPLWESWKESGMPAPCPELPVFFTNLVRFAPPLHLTKKKFPKDWIALGTHLLQQEFAACRPEVVYVLGADALKAVLGPKAKVEDYRGRVATWTVDCRATADDPADLHTAHLVVTDSPSRAAAEPDMYPALLHGTRTVAKLLGYGSAATEAVPLDHRAVYTYEELVQAVNESVKASSAGGYISFDAEWEGRHPSYPDSYLYTLQWSHAPGHARVVFLRRCGGAVNPALPLDKVRPLLKRLFEGAPRRGARLVGHFAKSDLPWLDSIGVDAYSNFVAPDHDDELQCWDKTYFEGGFDTYIAAHATEETGIHKLEVLAASILGVPRWDADVLEWKNTYCREQKISKSKLKGYGNYPEDRILPYAAWDCDATGRLYLYYNGDPKKGTRGLLDKDRFGNSSRKIFSIRMRAWGAWASMERYGMEVDTTVHHELREVVSQKRDELIARLREELCWQEVLDERGKVKYHAFTPSKRSHKVEFLFGEDYNKNSVRPPGSLSLYLTPYKATKAHDEALWDKALWRYEQNGGEPPSPAVDQESITHLSRQHDLVKLLRDIEFLSTSMKILLRPPKELVAGKVDEDEEDYDDDAAPVDENDVIEVHEKGLLAAVAPDGRARSMFGLAETGRARSGGGLNLQNITGAKDEQFDRILKWGKFAEKGTPESKRKFVSKSVFKARQGWYLVDADLKGAEIAIAAWFSGDPLLIEHARRNNLPEKHPEWLDLHSDLAKAAFNLSCSLPEIKEHYKPLRVAAKRSRFGHYYGASPATILRQVLEEGANEVTLEQIEAIVEGHDRMYPVLARFFAECRARAKSPGWLANCFGSHRRFRRSTEEKITEAQGREAQNWSCQGLVADAMNTGIGNLWYAIHKLQLRSRILLSVHDSIVVESPPDEVELFADDENGLIAKCFSKDVAIVPTDLDGKPITTRGPYHFGVSIDVFRSWGVPVSREEWQTHAAAEKSKVTTGR